jgi:hypothetical protein
MSQQIGARGNDREQHQLLEQVAQAAASNTINP